MPRIIVCVPRLAADYARTCVECGDAWRVPRSAARRRAGSISAFSIAPRETTIDRAELARQAGSISAENRRTDIVQHCPRCEANRCTQHDWHGEAPAF